MASFNQAIIIGNVGSDPEVRSIQDRKVATFAIATSSGPKDNKATDWHTIVAWSPLAEVCESYLHKGSSVMVSGEIRYRTYTDKQGVTRKTTEIMARQLQLLDKPASSDRQDPAPEAPSYRTAPAPQPEPTAQAAYDSTTPYAPLFEGTSIAGKPSPTVDGTMDDLPF